MILTKCEFVEYAMAYMARVHSERRVRKKPMPKYWGDIMRHCHKCGNAFRQNTMHQRVADGKHCWFCHGCWDGRMNRRHG